MSRTTVDNAASGPHAREIAVFWWPVGVVLALVYFAVAYRVFVRDRGALTR